MSYRYFTFSRSDRSLILEHDDRVMYNLSLFVHDLCIEIFFVLTPV